MPQSKFNHLLSALRSYLVFDPLIWLWTVFMATFSLLSSLVDRDGRMQQWFAVTWSKVILKIIGAPLAVHGMEKIDTTRPHMYALNHLSALDIPAVYAGLPFHFRIMAKEELFRYPFLGWHLRRSGQVSIERENAIASMRSLNRAAAILKGGQPLVVFPEGGRSPTGQVKPFLPGVFYVAIKAGVDVVPMALVGSYELLPMNTFHVKPRPLELLVGEPVSPAGYGPRDMDKLSARVQKAVEDLYYSRAEVLRAEQTKTAEDAEDAEKKAATDQHG
ncbi:MAG: lysophospholipid acyltransferase family protein [Terriglobales bacterium]